MGQIQPAAIFCLTHSVGHGCFLLLCFDLNDLPSFKNKEIFHIHICRLSEKVNCSDDSWPTHLLSKTGWSESTQIPRVVLSCLSQSTPLPSASLTLRPNVRHGSENKYDQVAIPEEPHSLPVWPL
jgi:hypothetical protein